MPPAASADALSPLPGITLVGSVHVSQATHDRVVQTIASLRPDVVAIELDQQRLATLDNTLSTVREEFTEFIHGNQTARGLLATVVFLKAQQQLRDTADYRPGKADMLPAVQTAAHTNSTIAFIDQLDANMMDSLGGAIWTDLTRLARNALTGNPTSILDAYRTLRNPELQNRVAKLQTTDDIIDAFEKITYEELDSYIEDIEEFAPTSVGTLLRQRDREMAGHLYWLHQNGYSTVAVMGKAHVPGVHEYLTHPESIPEQYIQQPPFQDNNDP